MMIELNPNRLVRSVYLASPEGFASGHKDYLHRVKAFLQRQAVQVWDPWEQNYGDQLAEAMREPSFDGRVQKNNVLAMVIGERNKMGIMGRDAVLGICEGAQVDDGTASEMGFAAGLGKMVFALRTDFRDLGDLPGVPFNLQVLYWVKSSGGKLFRKVEDIVLP
jgi:nucleoside 2-deoxyribosyltransferase